MSLPSNSIRPALGSWNPAMARRSVVLPDPEGPRMVRNSPFRTCEIEGAYGFEILELDAQFPDSEERRPDARLRIGGVNPEVVHMRAPRPS